MLNAVAFMHAWSMTHFVATGGQVVEEDGSARVAFGALEARLLVAGVTLARPRNRATPDKVGPAIRGCANSRRRTAIGAKPGTCLARTCHRRGRCVSCFTGMPAASRRCCPKRSYSTTSVARRCWSISAAAAVSSGNVTTIGFDEADDVRAAVRFAPDGAGLRCANLVRAVDGSRRNFARRRGARGRAARVDHRVSFRSATHHGQASLRGGRRAVVSLGRIVGSSGAVCSNVIGPSQTSRVEFARRVKCPVLLMHGAKDPRVALAEAESVLANLRGPEANDHLSRVRTRRQPDR